MHKLAHIVAFTQFFIFAHYTEFNKVSRFAFSLFLIQTVLWRFVP